MDLVVRRSTGRSTEAEVGRPVRSTDVHKRARQLGLVGRSTGRSTIQRALLSGNGPGRPAESCCSLYPVPVDQEVDRQRAVALCFQTRSTGRSVGGTTVIKMTIGRSTGRSTGRAKLPFPATNGQISFGTINTPPFELVSNKFF